MTLDYKVRIEGEQYGLPSSVNLFSINRRIRSVKGRYLDSDVSLYLNFDDNDEKLVRVEGQQFDSRTDLRFSYDSEVRISKVKGKKGGERVNIKVSYASLTYTHFINLKNGHHWKITYDKIVQLDDKKNLINIKTIPRILPRDIELGVDLKFRWEDKRLIRRIDKLRNETLKLSYEKMFSEPQTVYRTSRNIKSPPLEVDTETLINYFLFLH